MSTAGYDYVQALRDYGWNVRFHHMRRLRHRKEQYLMSDIRDSHMQDQILSTGGKTICYTWKKLPDGNHIEVAVSARCNNSDKFVRKIGAALAAERAFYFILGDQAPSD